MSLSKEALGERVETLRGRLAEQGVRVRKIVSTAFDAFFTADEEKAQAAIDLDNEIDELLQDFESKCKRQILHSVLFY